MKAIWCMVLAACAGGAAHADQMYVLTGLGNLFAVEGEEYLLPNGTISLAPRIVPHDFGGFFLAGERDDSDAVRFHSVYHIPGAVAANPASVYAAVGDSYVSSVVPNHGTYLYRNGNLELSTSGLDHVLGAMQGRVFEGTAGYRSGSNYVTFHGNGTAAYALKHVTYGGKAVDDFLVHVVCYASCGTVTAAKSHDDLIRFSGTLAQARLYDADVLGHAPVIISEDHYLIVDTTSGDVRLRAATYDYDIFEIRGMPRGTAYAMFEMPSTQWWPAAYAAHGCCYTPHEPIPAYRAGVQTGSYTISYDSDSLAASPGDRHDIEARTYADVLWWQGRASGWGVLFDYVNDQTFRFPGMAGAAVLPGAYVRVSSSAGAAISDVALARHACDAQPRIGMPYLYGALQPGESIHVPSIPGYPLLCVEMEGVRHTIPYEDMSGDARSIPLLPRTHNATIPPEPDTVPCVHCGYDVWQLRHDLDVYSHATAVTTRDGLMRLAVTGHGSYTSDVTRSWDTTHATTDVSYWAPSMPVRQDGSPVVSIYKNGMLEESVTVPCEPRQAQTHMRTAHLVGGVYAYGWELSHRYECGADVMLRMDLAVAPGDVIEVVLRVSPDMTYQTASRNGGGVADEGSWAGRTGGTLVISYR